MAIIQSTILYYNIKRRKTYKTVFFIYYEYVIYNKNCKIFKIHFIFQLKLLIIITFSVQFIYSFSF